MPNAPACLVTGYVRLDNGNRSHGEYERLAGELLHLHSPAVAFLDGIAAPWGVCALPASLRDCWLWGTASRASIPVGNPLKDTAAYHAVQHQKTAWLAEAADHTDADTLVWIDIGVLHNRSILDRHIPAFLAAVAARPPARITLPSIWSPGPGAVSPHAVNWTFAGTVAVVPRHMASLWDSLCRSEAAALFDDLGMVTWEVNTWANVARRHPDLFDTYQANHDHTLCTNYP